MVLKRKAVPRLEMKDLPGVQLVLGEDELVPPGFGDSSHGAGSLSWIRAAGRLSAETAADAA